MKTKLLPVLLLTATAVAAPAGGEGWMTDYDTAREKARAEGKDLLVDFTGSDWCGWCIRLNNEVFQHDSFRKGVAGKFVLLELDYPRDKSGQDEELQQQNEELKEKYAIRGFPTILLLDDEGRPYARTGYQEGGPEKYLEHLDELRGKRVERDRAFAAADKLAGVDKAKALVAALAVVPESQLDQYRDVAAMIARLDPDDESGFAARQKLKEDIKALEAEVGAKRKAGELDGAFAAVDGFLAGHRMAAREKQIVLGMKVSLGLQAKDYGAALEAIDGIIEADPDSANGKRAQSFRPHLVKMKEEAGDG